MSKPKRKLNVLIAYPYFSDAIRRILSERDPDDFRLIVDSGAFTAWNTGKVITVEEYIAFVKSLPTFGDRHVVQLDVFRDEEATLINLKKMQDAGLDVMPVFTRGGDPQRLEDFYASTDYIMFGGIVTGGKNREYAKWFLRQNKGRKAHWLGFVNVPFIKAYKPESVDSSAAQGAMRFGNLAYYTSAGKLSTLNRKKFAETPPEKVWRGLREVGFLETEFRLLAKQEAWKGVRSDWTPERIRQPKALACFMAYVTHIYRAQQIERRYGTKIYLAVPVASHLKCLFQAFDFLKHRRAI